MTELRDEHLEVISRNKAVAYEKENSNIHRGVHYLSQLSTNKFEQTRECVKDFINAQHTHEVIFTKGTTDSINLLAFSYSKILKKGDEVIVSEMEHHSNLVPWQMCCDYSQAILKVIPITSTGELDMNYFKKELNEKTKLVYECENLKKICGLKSYEFKIDSNCKKDFKITLTRRQHKLMTKLLVSNYTASLYENKYLILKNDFVPLEYVFILFSEDDNKRIKRIQYFETLRGRAETVLSIKELNELIEEFPNDKRLKFWKQELEERKSKKVEPNPTPDSSKREVKTNA